MVNLIVKEYKVLLERKEALELSLTTLPQGYISQKNIKGKTYCYLQHRVSGKLVSRYLKVNEIAETRKFLALRKQYEAQLPQILLRLGELEQAACLMDKNISRSLLLLKISIGMDVIDPTQKESSFAFANAMNAIEGISISDETARDLASWQDGSKNFLSVFENTLNRYGFSMEVR